MASEDALYIKIFAPEQTQGLLPKNYPLNLEASAFGAKASGKQ